jgi:hypothetical protein
MSRRHVATDRRVSSATPRASASRSSAIGSVARRTAISDVVSDTRRDIRHVEAPPTETARRAVHRLQRPFGLSLLRPPIPMRPPRTLAHPSARSPSSARSPWTASASAAPSAPPPRRPYGGSSRVGGRARPTRRVDEGVHPVEDLQHRSRADLVLVRDVGPLARARLRCIQQLLTGGRRRAVIVTDGSWHRHDPWIRDPRDLQNPQRTRMKL